MVSRCYEGLDRKGSNILEFGFGIGSEVTFRC